MRSKGKPSPAVNEGGKDEAHPMPTPGTPHVSPPHTYPSLACGTVRKKRTCPSVNLLLKTPFCLDRIHGLSYTSLLLWSSLTIMHYRPVGNERGIGCWTLGTQAVGLPGIFTINNPQMDNLEGCHLLGSCLNLPDPMANKDTRHIERRKHCPLWRMVEEKENLLTLNTEYGL
jgi:hypothetical protein